MIIHPSTAPLPGCTPRDGRSAICDPKICGNQKRIPICCCHFAYDIFSLLVFRLFLAKSWFRARHRLAARESCAESGREMAHLKEYLDHLDRLHGAVYSVSGEPKNDFEIFAHRYEKVISKVFIAKRYYEINFNRNQI